MHLSLAHMQKMTWNEYIKNQQDFCKKQGLAWISADLEFKIGLADNVLTNLNPINGLRHEQKGETTGWYIWSGQDFSDADDFFKPYHVKHLINIKPEIIKYLGLPPGFRFLIDNNEYEDVWEDKTLINTA